MREQREGAGRALFRFWKRGYVEKGDSEAQGRKRLRERPRERKAIALRWRQRIANRLRKKQERACEQGRKENT